MPSGSILPTHNKRYVDGAPTFTQRRILRITEKYVLAIAFVAFCLVFFGALQLPQETSSQLGSYFKPNVDNPHGHELNKAGHGDLKFAEGVQTDEHLARLVLSMEAKLNRNKEELQKLKKRLEAVKQPGQEGDHPPVPAVEKEVEAEKDKEFGKSSSKSKFFSHPSSHELDSMDNSVERTYYNYLLKISHD